MIIYKPKPSEIHHCKKPNRLWYRKEYVLATDARNSLWQCDGCGKIFRWIDYDFGWKWKPFNQHSWWNRTFNKDIVNKIKGISDGS